MKKFAVILFATALLGTACAQVVPAAAIPGRNDFGVSAADLRAFTDRIRSQSTASRSGQFTVFAPSVVVHNHPPDPRTGANLIFLEPRLLVVSCERIKESLWRTLGTAAPWRGKIDLNLHPARSANDPITLVADRMPGGWRYQVDLPDLLEQGCFVRTMVDVLLLEMANRNAGSRSAEIPAWLAEGLSQELLASDGIEIILAPPSGNENGLSISRQVVHLTDAQTGLGVNTRKLNPLTDAQKTLRARPPLTFEQLSWPTAEQLSGEAGGVYRSSAQLFVNQLLQLPDGPACFRALLAELPRRYNWQFAFLAGFQPHFQRLLDVEKWWALQLVQFSGRDLMQTWTLEESWKKLNDIVRSPIEVRVRQQELPLRTEVSLQMIIREWDTVRQAQTLQRKLQELNLLRSRVAHDLALLVDEYRQVLGTYLQKRGTSGRFLPFGKAAGPISDRLAQETIKQLDALDAKRTALRPSPDSIATADDRPPGSR